MFLIWSCSFTEIAMCFAVDLGKIILSIPLKAVLQNFGIFYISKQIKIFLQQGKS